MKDIKIRSPAGTGLDVENEEMITVNLFSNHKKTSGQFYDTSIHDHFTSTERNPVKNGSDFSDLMERAEINRHVDQTKKIYYTLTRFKKQVIETLSDTEHLFLVDMIIEPGGAPYFIAYIKNEMTVGNKIESRFRSMMYRKAKTKYETKNANASQIKEVRSGVCITFNFYAKPVSIDQAVLERDAPATPKQVQQPEPVKPVQIKVPEPVDIDQSAPDELLPLAKVEQIQEVDTIEADKQLKLNQLVDGTVVPAPVQTYHQRQEDSAAKNKQMVKAMQKAERESLIAKNPHLYDESFRLKVAVPLNVAVSGKKDFSKALPILKTPEVMGISNQYQLFVLTQEAVDAYRAAGVMIGESDYDGARYYIQLRKCVEFDGKAAVVKMYFARTNDPWIAVSDAEPVNEQ